MRMKKIIINVMIIFLSFITIIPNPIIGGSLYQIEPIQVNVTQGETKDIEIVIINNNNFSINVREFQVVPRPCYNICPTMEILTDSLEISENSSGIINARVYSDINNKVGITNRTITCIVEGGGEIENGIFNIPINVKWNPSTLLIPIILILCIIGIVVFIIHKRKKP